VAARESTAAPTRQPSHSPRMTHLLVKVLGRQGFVVRSGDRHADALQGADVATAHARARDAGGAAGREASLGTPRTTHLCWLVVGSLHKIGILVMANHERIAWHVLQEATVLAFGDIKVQPVGHLCTARQGERGRELPSEHRVTNRPESGPSVRVFGTLRFN
jgi:hypothetical protein